MRQILHPLFALLASSARQDLARQVAYLKEENRILRSKLPKQVSVTEKERNPPRTQPSYGNSLCHPKRARAECWI